MEFAAGSCGDSVGIGSDTIKGAPSQFTITDLELY